MLADRSGSVDGIMRTAVAKLSFFSDPALAEAMRTRLETLREELRENLAGRDGGGIRLGFDYVVEARWPSECTI